MDGVEIVVLSNDHALRRELELALAGRVGIRTTVTAWADVAALQPGTADCIVVIDDEGCDHGTSVLQSLRARGRATRIVYLAARHSVELERAVRRIGVSYYADKAATGRNALLVIERMLRATGARSDAG